MFVHHLVTISKSANGCPFEPILQAKEYYLEKFDAETSTDGDNLLVCMLGIFYSLIGSYAICKYTGAGFKV